jgi:hypothetical protein
VIAVYRTVFAVYRGGIFAFGYRFPSGRKNPDQDAFALRRENNIAGVE